MWQLIAVMRYRIFEDYVGRRWEVWQTSPPQSDRRKAERRSVVDRRQTARASSTSRRNVSERRVRSVVRIPCVPGLEGGWLCFESNGERKRLAPVPEAWETAGEMTLAALCNFATKVIPSL